MSVTEYINSITLTTTSSSVVFDQIPATYEDLIITCNVRLGSASGSKIRFNTVSTSTYSWTYLIGQESSVGSSRASNVTSIYNNFVWGDATVASSYTPYLITINSYRNTTINNRTLLWQYGTATGLQGSRSEVGIVSGSWRSTDPISSIEFSPYNATTYQAGSQFTLWGVK